ncbi:sensor histidine kinase [Leucobacter sp. W1478]|uniref:sensor histidine kinase n=1 Tax=Leucobacter sp. W1478 TaxID=3439065 RepID=UPI003F2D1D2D
MTPTAIVLASVALGVLAGALATWVILSARAAGRRRAQAMRPELPEVAVEILNSVDSFAVILDASLSVVYANPVAREDARVTGEELRDPDFLHRARRVMTTGVPDTRLPDPEDPSDTVRVLIVRLQERFLAVFAFDLGEEQRVNAMRRDFIANVSHELKTPIAAIGLLSEAVLEGADEPDIVRNFARRLIKESRRLGDLSRDIIQLSEAQSTLRPEDREEVSLRAVVRTEVEAHRDFASQHGVSLVLTDIGDASGDLVTLGRPASIGTVLANLLSNAIRHSPEGGRVGIGIEATKRTCTITVTDQGEGIPPEHLPRIFERFYRVDTARSREGGGTGLGLSIARHTMRAHGGDIDVWSQPGVGASFILTFPVVDHGGTDKKSKRKRRPAEPTASNEYRGPRPAAADTAPSLIERAN